MTPHRAAFLDSLPQDEVHRVGGRGANKRQGKPASAELLHQPRSQIPGHRTETGKGPNWKCCTRVACRVVCGAPKQSAIRVTSPHLSPPATAGRNHKDVSNLGEKCPLHKICKCSLAVTNLYCCCETLSLKRMSLLKPSSQNSAACPAIWLFKWSDFSTKRRSLSMQKSLRLAFKYTT